MPLIDMAQILLAAIFQGCPPSSRNQSSAGGLALRSCFIQAANCSANIPNQTRRASKRLLLVCIPRVQTARKRKSLSIDHTNPSYSDRAETIVSSLLLPSLNSAMSRLPFSSLSIILNIFLTLFSGVSSSSGSLTMEPTIL